MFLFAMEINDLIFKELIKRGYALEGNTRVWNIADSKLRYLTPEQAQAYLDLEGSNEYRKLVGTEFELIENNMKEIIKELGDGSFNIVDLGCGDGNKAAHIIEHLRKKSKIRYCPIDISGYMVHKAVGTVSKMNVGEIIDQAIAYANINRVTVNTIGIGTIGGGQITEDITLVGHRVVHGGEFTKPLKITSENLQELEKISHLAPLHNPYNISAIKVCLNIFKSPI